MACASRSTRGAVNGPSWTRTQPGSARRRPDKRWQCEREERAQRAPQPRTNGGSVSPVGPDRDAFVRALRAAGCVFAEQEADLLLAASATGPADPGRLAQMLARRVAGEPLEHVLGWCEFAGLRVAVAPGV